MIRNFVTGIVVGGVVAGAGLGVISEVLPMPHQQAEAVAATELKQAEPAKPAAANDTTLADTAQSAAAEAKPAAPENPAPASVEAANPESVDADAAKAGADAVVDAAPIASEATKAAADAAQVAPAATLAPEPAVPASETAEAEPATVSPADTAPQPKPAAEVPSAPAAPDGGASAPQVLAQVEPAPAPTLPQNLPATGAADVVPAPADLPPPPAPETNETLLTPQPVEKAPLPGMIKLDPAPETAPAMPEPAPKALPKVLDTTKMDKTIPDAGLPKTVDGVTTGRLPRIGDAAKPAADAPADGAAPEGATDQAPADDRPVIKFAREFSNDDGKPLFAVLLLDKGGADVDRAKLAALPFPVTFVLDPLDPGADAAEAIYRAAGQEVVMLASGIPAGATAGDLEQTFQANAAVLDQAVAVMDIGADGFQDNRPLATQVVPVIAAQGRGVVTFDKGLNAANQVARRDGVPAAVIFRELDAAGEDSPLIRRYLDRAAFKAAQEGRVVVLGSTQPETVAALMEWTVEGRASSVALAPLTAVMAVK